MNEKPKGFFAQAKEVAQRKKDMPTEGRLFGEVREAVAATRQFNEEFVAEGNVGNKEVSGVEEVETFGLDINPDELSPRAKEAYTAALAIRTYIDVGQGTSDDHALLKKEVANLKAIIDSEDSSQSMAA